MPPPPLSPPPTQVVSLFTRRSASDNLRDALNKMDDGDNVITLEELQAALEHNPAALEILKTVGVKELMAKYDVSGDGVLDREELKLVLEDLAIKEAELRREKERAAEEGEDGADGEAQRAARPAATSSVEALLATQAMLSTEFKQRIERVETQIGEMSRSVAKKLSLMIDLVMSLSDQVATAGAAPVPAGPAGLPSTLPPLPAPPRLPVPNGRPQ